jgi:hypothetical protein
VSQLGSYRRNMQFSKIQVISGCHCHNRVIFLLDAKDRLRHGGTVGAAPNAAACHLDCRQVNWRPQRTWQSGAQRSVRNESSCDRMLMVRNDGPIFPGLIGLWSGTSTRLRGVGVGAEEL